MKVVESDGGDGLEVTGAPPLPAPAAAVSVSIGGLPAQTTYAGAAPDQVSGVLQMNAMVPAGLSPQQQPTIRDSRRAMNVFRKQKNAWQAKAPAPLTQHVFGGKRILLWHD